MFSFSIIAVVTIPIAIAIAVFWYIKHIKNSAEYIDFNTQLIHNDWSIDDTGESITLEELRKILVRIDFFKKECSKKKPLKKESLNKDIKQVLDILYNQHKGNITTLSVNKVNNATQLGCRPLNVNRVRSAISFLVQHQVIETHRDGIDANSYTFYLTKLNQFL